MAAVLHDVVEDTDWTFEDLKKEGFDEALIEALDCKTRPRGESYKGYISAKLARQLFGQGIEFITSIRDNMKNKLMSMSDKLMLRKRSLIETINENSVSSMLQN